MHQQTVVAFRLTKPTFYSRHHVETDRPCLIDIDSSAVGKQEDWLAFLVLPSRPHNVIHVDLMSDVVDVFYLIAVEGDLRVP